jgi:hypothetical protein
MLDNVDFYVYTNYYDKMAKTDFRQIKELCYAINDKVKLFSTAFYR